MSGVQELTLTLSICSREFSSATAGSADDSAHHSKRFVAATDFYEDKPCTNYDHDKANDVESCGCRLSSGHLNRLQNLQSAPWC